MEKIGKTNISSKLSKRRLVLIKDLIDCSFSIVLFEWHIISIFKLSNFVLIIIIIIIITIIIIIVLL